MPLRAHKSSFCCCLELQVQEEKGGRRFSNVKRRQGRTPPGSSLSIHKGQPHKIQRTRYPCYFSVIHILYLSCGSSFLLRHLDVRTADVDRFLVLLFIFSGVSFTTMSTTMTHILIYERPNQLQSRRLLQGMPRTWREL